MHSEHSSNLLTQGPCESCGSSDAKSVYSDGHTYCYKCRRMTQPDGSAFPKINFDKGYVVPYRGISRATFKHYGFQFYSSVDDVDELIALEERYDADHSTLRNLTGIGKKFLPFHKVNGSHRILGGADLWQPNSARYVTVAEGAMDGLSLAEAFDCKYPVVWYMSATAPIDEAAIKYLDSFPTIVFCPDTDKPGQEQLEKLITQFHPTKVKVMDVRPYPDANALLQALGREELQKRFWSAQRYNPDYLYNSGEEFARALSDEKVGQVYDTPFPTLNSITRGLATGHTYLLKGMEGIGKTELLRALAYHMMAQHKQKVGIIFLEESTKRTLQGFATYMLGVPTHFPDAPVSSEDVLTAIKLLNEPEGLLNIYRIRDLSDPLVILKHVEYLVKIQGCKFIFLDPVQQLVSLADNSDETKVLDQLATNLAKLIIDTDACLVMTSHVNDDGRTRSSRMLSKAASIVIDLERDITAADPVLRNTTQLMVVKNRPFSITGPGGHLFFDLSNFQLSEVAPPTKDAVSGVPF